MSGYPAGAEFDSRAPWLEEDYDEAEELERRREEYEDMQVDEYLLDLFD